MIDNEQNNIYKMDSRKKINLTKIDKYLKVKKTIFYRSCSDTKYLYLLSGFVTFLLFIPWV